jgi:hypothetical protein
MPQGQTQEEASRAAQANQVARFQQHASVASPLSNPELQGHMCSKLAGNAKLHIGHLPHIAQMFCMSARNHRQTTVMNAHNSNIADICMI